ncbi:MAG: LytTR family DNA-binding domain-containing protein [Clostridiales bacterium]|nr:LytTR family DNA-binding domain-containing protein [Clostridiales bacterium]
MGDMDGVSLAKRLRQDNETLQIVFVTGYSDYIAEGYEVAALHYLMKPLKKEKFFAVLNRAAEKLRKNEKVLTLDLSGETVRVPVWQILYAEVQLNYVTIHAKEDVRVKMTLSDLQRELDDRFYRVGRSAIVNLTQVRRVTRMDIYLAGEVVLPLPRGAYEGLNRAIIQMG